MLFNPIKDQTIDGLEEWLKNNKPTVVPRGVSTATGYTPPAPSERTQQESKQRAQEINKMIRAENAAKKSEAKANYKAQKAIADKKTKREVVEAIKQFKTKARGGDFGRLAEAVGVARKTLSNWACGDSVPNDTNKMHLLRAISNFNHSFFPKPAPTTPADRRGSSWRSPRPRRREPRQIHRGGAEALRKIPVGLAGDPGPDDARFPRSSREVVVSGLGHSQALG